MALKLYVDRLSQPSRALLVFCKANGIEFEEVKIDLAKKQHLSPEYAEVNPMKKVPAMVHGDFKLCESHAILIFLASAFPGVAEHCCWRLGNFEICLSDKCAFWNQFYKFGARNLNHQLLLFAIYLFGNHDSYGHEYMYPSDVCKRAKIHSVLDWHHTNLRRGSVGYIFNTLIALSLGMPPNLKAAAEGEILLSASLETIESLWLEEDKPFLLGSSEPSLQISL